VYHNNEAARVHKAVHSSPPAPGERFTGYAEVPLYDESNAPTGYKAIVIYYRPVPYSVMLPVIIRNQ
jgi:hypothetical protein